jgi:hypothetical protein
MSRLRALGSGLLAALLISVVGGAAVLWHRPLLFASLGPTAMLQVHSPNTRQARIANVLFGHLVGATCAFLAVLLFGLTHALSVFQADAVSLPRVGASALALGVATVLELLTDRVHVPAASTTLLITLGSFKPDPHDIATVFGGVVLIAVIGEAVRRALAKGQDA